MMGKTSDAAKKEIPPMPALSMHGHDVYLVVFHEEAERNVMYGKMQLGKTDTVTGVFQVLAALDVLVDWANTEYPEWLESAISV